MYGENPPTCWNWDQNLTLHPVWISSVIWGYLLLGLFFFFLTLMHIFNWFCWVLVASCEIFSLAACGIFSYRMWTLGCSVWDLVPCMRAKSLHATLCDPVDCSPPGSSVHGILQARILGWVAMPSSRGSSQPRDGTWVSYVSCVGRWVLYY